MLFSYRAQLFSTIRAKSAGVIERNEREGRPETEDFGLSVVTKGTSRTQFKALTVTRNDIDMFLEDDDRSLAHMYGKLYTDIHRVFTEFTLNLFDEIASIEPRVLLTNYANRKLSFREALEADSALEAVILSTPTTLSHGSLADRTKAFEQLGLPFRKDQGLLNSLHLMEATRNVIEHNDGRVNELFVARTGSSIPLGEMVPLDPEILTAAFGTVEWIGDDLNVRAVEKFGLGA